MTVEQPRISYRFLLQARWIAFHLVVVLGIVLMINLGFWQLDRLDQRQSFNASVEARSDEPVVPLADLLGAPDFDPNTAQWRIVTATGTWIEDQVVVFNRTQGGRAGDNVVTALATDDGEVVLSELELIEPSLFFPHAPGSAARFAGAAVAWVERVG